MTDDRQGRRRRRLTATVTDLEVRRQRAFLVAMALDGDDAAETEASLEELGLLTDTARSEPVDEELLRSRPPDAGTFIGRGKAEELAGLTAALDIDVVVFDNALTPAQQRNLQDIFHCDVVDRQAVILDIFAQHASSRAGMLQVELALLRYHLPRLRGRGTQLSRQAGGIGTRGPGETKLETDRRRILRRIARLEQELKNLQRSRNTQRKARHRTELPTVALVGYTNAGKSTLLNRLTGAGVLTEEGLFSTLDPTVRRCRLPDGTVALLADTVGFVRRLPLELVEAFRATLEEVTQADLLLHLVDGSDPAADRQIAAVRTVLDQIGAGSIPELLVFNKRDRADPVPLRRLLELHPDSSAVSALTGDGTEHMGAVLAAVLHSRAHDVELEIPYERGDLLAALHREGEVLHEMHGRRGTVVKARIPPARLSRFAEFVSEAPEPTL